MLLNEGGYARANYVCFLDDWKILVLQKTKNIYMITFSG